MAVEGVALRKRQQIAKANRTMFLWVAGVSAVVGIAIVASIFLFERALFKEKVLAEKSKTASTLVANNKVVEELQNQIRILNTNDNLKKVMVPGEAQPIQVVLDALPSEANSSAFGASLQQKFLQASGLQLESLTVDPVQDVEVSTLGADQSTTASATEEGTENQIRFSFTVSTEAGNAGALKELLTSLERSIRPINVTNATIEAQGERLNLKVDGTTRYQPMKTADLKNKTVKP